MVYPAYAQNIYCIAYKRYGALFTGVCGTPDTQILRFLEDASE
jgi:hypothetical protein